MRIFKMEFFEGNMNDVVNSIVNHAKYGKTFEVVTTPNSDHCIHLEKLSKIDNEFVTHYRNAKWHLADGMPIVWASKLLGTPLKGRLTGSDLLPALLRAAEANRLSISVLGASEELLNEFYLYCKVHYPDLIICDCAAASYPFDPSGIEAKEIAATFSEYHPHIVLTGVGFPKQEKWLFSNGSTTGARVGVAIGAAIEFLCKKKSRSPVLMQRLGLEWFYRLLHEPQRLIGRYSRNFYIFILILKEVCKRLVSITNNNWENKPSR